MTHRSNRSLKVPALARSEGEGAMHVRVERGTVTDVRLEIYEPPRFFESFLRGRSHTEPPGITARICGVCPVAYQISACNAIEDACGVVVDEEIIELRRLLYCGEWIANHALHIYVMHAPDFLGHPGVVGLARAHPALVKRGLDLKKTGKSLVEAIGSAPFHAANVRVGGFHQAPDLGTLRELAAHTLPAALDDAIATAEWVAGFDFPDFTHDHELLALVDPLRYPIERGVPGTSAGLSFPVTAFDEHVIEEPVEDSATFRARLAGRGRYLTGPAARYALNADRLAPIAKEMAAKTGLPTTFRNPFRSILVRSVEMIHAVEEALRLIEAYEPPKQIAVDVPPRAGIGYGASEAARGVLFHRYALAEDGTITSARILPPTSQNRASIEDDLRRFVQDRLDLEDDQLARECEQAIRNYDPCISCATHYVSLKVVRS
jgi:coenzyme F420-reducing hydrogenase alpha subunit